VSAVSFVAVLRPCIQFVGLTGLRSTVQFSLVVTASIAAVFGGNRSRCISLFPTLIVNVKRLSFPLLTTLYFPVVLAHMRRLLILLLLLLARKCAKNHHIFCDSLLNTTCGLF